MPAADATEVTVTVPAGAVTDLAGRANAASETLRVAVQGPESDDPGPATNQGITASFHEAPATHDGAAALSFEVHISEAFKLRWRTMLNHAPLRLRTRGSPGPAGPGGRSPGHRSGLRPAGLARSGGSTPYARLALAESESRSWHFGARRTLAESLNLTLETRAAACRLASRTWPDAARLGLMVGVPIRTFDDGQARFQHVAAPTRAELQRLLHTIATRIARALEKPGSCCAMTEPPPSTSSPSTHSTDSSPPPSTTASPPAPHLITGRAAAPARWVGHRAATETWTP